MTKKLFLITIGLYLISLFSLSSVTFANEVSSSDSLYNEARHYEGSYQPYKALELYSLGFSTTSEERFSQGILRTQKIILDWSMGSHSRGDFQWAIWGYSKLLESPQLDTGLINVTKRNKLQAEANKEVFNLQKYLINGNQLLNVHNPYLALEMFTEGYAFFKDANLYRGISKSSGMIKEWAVGSHSRGDFYWAIYGYSKIIESPFVPQVMKEEMSSFKELALANQVLYTPEWLLQLADSSLNSNPYKALDLYSEGLARFPDYSNIERFKKGQDTAIRTILTWSVGSHKEGHYTVAIVGYNKVLSLPGISQEVANYAKRNKGRAENNLSAYDLSVYKAEGERLLSQYRPYEALALLSEGYHFYKDEVLLSSLTDSGKMIMEWSLGSHNIGDYKNAIIGYTSVINYLDKSSSFSVVARINISRAEKSQKPMLGVLNYLQEGNRLLEKFQPYSAMEVFSEGYNHFFDARLYSGLVKSSNMVFEWSRGSHQKGHYEMSISGYKRLIDTPHVPQGLKVQAEKFTQLARRNLNVSGRTVVLDAGHGGRDPGAVGSGYWEKTLNIQLVQKISTKLIDLGFNVILTRQPDNDVYISLPDRANFANSMNPDLFLSVHHDSSVDSNQRGVSAHYSSYRPGIEVNDVYVRHNGRNYPFVREDTAAKLYYYLDNGVTKSASYYESNIAYDPTPSSAALKSAYLAQRLAAAMAETGYFNRGAIDHNLYLTRWTNMPSVIIEAGFISNPIDARSAANQEVQERKAERITEVILEFFTRFSN